MTKKTALILGATGVVGTQLINVLSTNNNYEVIHLLSRREVEYQNPRCKLQIVDFDNLDKYR